MSDRSVVGELFKDLLVGALMGTAGATLFGVVEAATNTATGLLLPLALWGFTAEAYAILGLLGGLGLGFLAWLWRRLPLLPKVPVQPLIGALFLGGLLLFFVGIPLNERALPNLLSVRGLLGNAVFLGFCAGFTLLFYFLMRSPFGPGWVAGFLNLVVWLSVLLTVGDHIDTFFQPISSSPGKLGPFFVLLGACVALYLVMRWALRALASEGARLVPGGVLAVLLLVALALVLRLHEGGAGTTAEAPKGKPNVVWLVMDTTRADHLSAYGYDRPTSPSLERVAAEGALFENAFSESSWTIPGHFVMATGQLAAGREKLLAEDFVTAPEVFRDNGYETAAMLANMSLGRGSGFEQGYDRTVDGPVRIFYLAAFEKLPVLRLLIGLGITPPDWALRMLDRKTFLQNEAVRAENMNAFALDWIDERDPSRPFFLFINYMDPHDSYDPPKEFREKLAGKAKPVQGFVRYRGDKRKTISSNEFVRDVAPRLSQADWRRMAHLYDAEIAYLDAQIGKLLEALEERGLLDNTIVVITSDHGELFGEHGLGNHFKTLSDEETHIPLLLRYPPGVPAGRRVEAPVQLRDILPTVLELAGIKSTAPMDGQSVAALTQSSTGEAPGARQETVGYLHRPVDKEYPFTASGHLLGLRTPQEKYVWSSTGKHEYYDLSADPAAQKNLHGQAPSEAQMAERLAAWRKEAGFDNFGEKQKGVDRLMKDKLKALGYAQ